MHTLRRSCMVLIAAFALILAPQAAHAAALACDGAGGVAGGTLYEADPVAGTGACENVNPPLQHVFSMVVCNFVMILNDVLGAMYCGLQFSMQNILGIVLTIYIAIFGMQILMGTAHMNSKEIILRLLKIAGVWAFATQSLWGINMAFGFFVSLITSGVWWATSMIMPVGGIGDSVMPVYGFLDQWIFNFVTGPLVGDGAKLVGFFKAIFLVLPTAALLAGSWLWLTLVTLARTLVSFMLAVSAIAFLIALSPIFLSFMLFQSTFHLFEGWLRYMLSYSLQIIIVFAVIALWVEVMMLFINFFDQLAALIFDFRALAVGGAVTDPSYTYAICPPVYGASPMGPTAVCPAGFNPALVLDAAGKLDGNADYKALIHPSLIPEKTEFIYFMAFHLISLGLVAYAFNALMRDAPEIAKHIVGPAYAPVLVGGWGMEAGWLGRRAHRGAYGGLSNRIGQGLDNAFGGSGNPTGGRNAPGADFVDRMRGMIESRK